MSNGMAFVAGAGFAGLAGLLLLKGGLPTNLPSAVSLSNPPAVQPSPNAPMIPGNLSPDVNSYCSQYCAQQQLNLKNQLDQLQAENEQLKQQSRNQQFVIDALTTQNKTNNGLTPQINQAQQLTANSQASNPALSGVIWGLGGMVVTVAAGAVLAGAFALISRQQRPNGTMQMVQPVNQLPPSLPYRRRSELSSSRLNNKRTNYFDYDEYEDYDDYEYDGK